MQVARHWRLKKQRYNMENIPTPVHDRQGQQIAERSAVPVSSNGNGHHAPAVMPLETEQAVETGTRYGSVYSHTVVYYPPAGFQGDAPYTVALVELDDGRMVTAQLTDLDGDPEIGMRVEMVVRKLRSEGNSGMIVYGYKFRPTLH